jgi:hypothetical protein
MKKRKNILGIVLILFIITACSTSKNTITFKTENVKIREMGLTIWAYHYDKNNRPFKEARIGLRVLDDQIDTIVTLSDISKIQIYLDKNNSPILDSCKFTAETSKVIAENYLKNKQNKALAAN